MKRITLTILLTFIVVTIGLTVNLQAGDPTVIARFNLQQRTDFDRFKNMEITPFFRIGNVFFAEVDQARLAAVRRAKISYEVVDDQPFSRPYYVGTIESLLSRKVPAPDLEQLTDVGDWAFYAGLHELD